MAGFAPESGFFRELQELNVEEIKAYLGSCQIPFEQSELYVVAMEQNVIDSTKRQSEFRKINDPELFDLIEPLVHKLSKDDPLLNYTLLRSDVAQIRYTKGGFFSRHQDYQSLTSNLLEEFSMLVCITPDEHVKPNQGGKTVIHMHRGSHVSDATTTPGCALAFRKDLEHESTVLQDGEKHIIMLNLWATRKDAGSVLLVKFDTCRASKKARVTEKALRELACEQSYALPTAEAMRSRRLAEHISACTARSTGSVISYSCKDYDYDAFGTVFRILRRMYISGEELSRNADAIECFGLNTEHLLVAAPKSVPEAAAQPPILDEFSQYDVCINMLDGSSHALSVASSTSVREIKADLKARTGLSGLSLFLPDAQQQLTDGETIASCGFPSEFFTLKRMTKVDEYNLLGLTKQELERLAASESEEQEDGGDVIVCESEARAKVVAEAALEANLPFVSFQALLLEGALNISGDTCRPCNHEFKMDPAFISLGDRQQVLGLARADEDWDGFRYLDLQTALSHEKSIHDVIQHVMGECRSQNNDVDSDVDSDLDLDEERAEKAHPLNVPVEFSALDEEDGNLYQIDNGRTCITSKQGAAVSAHLQHILFVDQLKDRVNKISWELPQSTSNRSETLCNERVYGHLNVLLVSGVVRMTSSRKQYDGTSKER